MITVTLCQSLIVRRDVRKQGQALTEVLTYTGLLGIAAIVVVTLYGKQIRSGMAALTGGMAGNEAEVVSYSGEAASSASMDADTGNYTPYMSGAASGSFGTEGNPNGFSGDLSGSHPGTVPASFLDGGVATAEQEMLPPSIDNPDQIFDSVNRFNQGDVSAIADIISYTDGIPGGSYIFAGGDGGLRAGATGAQVKVDIVSAGLKVKKNHDGSVEFEVSGQFGAKVGGELAVGGSAGGGIRGSKYVKISQDGQTITFGTKGGVGGSMSAGLQTPVFVRADVDSSAMVGYELEMPTQTYASLDTFDRATWDATGLGYEIWLAGRNEDVGLFVTTEVKTTAGGSAGVQGGGGFGPGGGFEAGAGWVSEGVNHLPEGLDRIQILWYDQLAVKPGYLLVTIIFSDSSMEIAA